MAAGLTSWLRNIIIMLCLGLTTGSKPLLLSEQIRGYIGVFYAYTHESSTQDALALRTRDGGLNIFYDQSTLPSHPVPQTLMQ